MAIKLYLKDWKILNQLDLNSRQSDAGIGRKTRISKQVVNYRINKLKEEGIITSSYPHINIAKLGYAAHKIYLNFKALTKEKEDEMWTYLSKLENVIWVISCSGRWNLIFAIISQNIEEFNKTLNEFMNKYSKYVSERGITVFNKATLHHRKWLLKNKQENIYWLLGGKVLGAKIDETDKNILEILNKDAITPIIEIAEKLRISSSLIIQRIKKLKEKGIIGTFRIGLNREKLGINYCKAFVYYQNKTSEQENKLLEYCYSLQNILGVSQSIGPWDLELEFEVKDYNDFHKIMKEMKNKFQIIANFETVYIEKEYGLSFMPMQL